MIFTVNKPLASAGAPQLGAREVLLVRVEDILIFPPHDYTGVFRPGNIVLKTLCYPTGIYITMSSREYSLEASGEQDAHGYKLKFTGTHPGTEMEALRFIRENLDADFVVVMPDCSGGMSRVLGSPCNPLTLRGSHKSNKEGAKFELTLEQEVAGEDVYSLLPGSIFPQGVPDRITPNGNEIDIIGSHERKGVYILQSSSQQPATVEYWDLDSFSDEKRFFTIVAGRMNAPITIKKGNTFVMKSDWTPKEGDSINFKELPDTRCFVEVFRTVANN